MVHHIEAYHDSVLRVKLQNECTDGDISYVHVVIESDEEISFPQVQLAWHYPAVNIQAYWHPGSFRNKNLGVDWSKGFSSKGTVVAPVGCFLSSDGRNRLAIAYSNAIETVNFNMGIREEDGTIRCQITLFSEPSKPMKRYEGTIRIDQRDIPFEQAIQAISYWYESMDAYRPCMIPKAATFPMYSTWYSFHQELVDKEIEEQCRMAKEIGCDTVIVDDGWQTTDNQRGYAYCGDWEVAHQKIGNMKTHVQKVQAMGMKYILWYSMPFIGLHSKVWDTYKDKLLVYREHLQAGVLDPRYPEVREYLISTYETALNEWGVDGFKLDFIDEFDLNKANDKALEKDGRRDFDSVQEAVECLLEGIFARLHARKADVMIEFRQKYIGPFMRRFGNIFRVADCPNDAVTNRVGTIDLRLFSGKTAVHSDMLMWSPEDTVENAALQLINVLFAVPQLSMRFEKLPPEHIEMTKFWLKFWRENRDVLLFGELRAEAPELLYPNVQARNSSKVVMAVFGSPYVKVVEPGNKKLFIMNGTLHQELVLDVDRELPNRVVEIYDCCGNLVSMAPLAVQKVPHRLKVKPSGLVILTCLK
ncbi:glycoside hydrolase family 36 protein [Brevibacillus brevis]|uniref:glycoside hydrolase family 36 protein n=1 Tax=Brevibacillus brevis TaxID=1393 RepID=UPI001159641C|nr:glycoside hydrolase family 36 protein [Lysinibacillus sp. SDF0063]TQR37395.1 alpha-galactosidase [Lysinibacillus sp. SDF0063]